MGRYVEELLAGREGTRGKDFNMRWVASMVAGVFRILARGGRDRIPEVVSTSAHQRVPVILGSRNEVERVTSCYA